MSPIDLRMPNFADKDFIPFRLQSMRVATQEYPASPVSPASQSLCLDLDAISSEDSDAKPGDALSASPILVISVYSSESDPDSSDVHSSAGSPSVPGSPTSVCVVESPSHYPTPDEPVALSAVSSMLISPNRVREDCVSVTAEVYLVFEVSPDTTGSVPTSPPVPPSSSLPVSLDGMVLVFPLLPLPDGMVLVLAPDDVLSLSEHPSQGGQRPCVVSSSRDLSREGPFAVSDEPSDTGVHPLVTDMLLGCPYRITSYEPMNLADVDPVYGLQLTHPMFLEFIGAPESACLLNGSSGPDDGP